MYLECPSRRYVVQASGAAVSVGGVSDFCASPPTSAANAVISATSFLTADNSLYYTQRSRGRSCLMSCPVRFGLEALS